MRLSLRAPPASETWALSRNWWLRDLGGGVLAVLIGAERVDILLRSTEAAYFLTVASDMPDSLRRG